MESVYEGYESLLEQVNLQEKQLRHKRRWLIGLPISQSEAGKSKGSHFPIERTMPECLLREDDVSYETIKSFIENGAGVCNTQQKFHTLQDNMHLLYSPRDFKGLLSLIDNMTNQGLLCFVEVLTGGAAKFEKTRWKMKKIIKRCLLEVFAKEDNTRRRNLLFNDSSILTKPSNFCWSSESRFIPDPESYHAAVLKILDILEFLPSQTLSAMHRKLKGKKGYMPQLTAKKSGWGRDTLIKRLRKMCMGLLSKLDKGDALQEPLAKAMEVASLTLKLIQGCHYVTNFRQFSPEITVLQNEIAMSIQVLDDRVELPVLKDIKALLDPKAKLLDRNLRASLRNILTEYLLECSDMDTVPHFLLEVLALIKQSSEAPFKHVSEMKIEEEVECILSVSASAKQILWDLIPGRELDLEFADAYMEDLEESDCDDIKIEEHMQNDNPHCSHSDEGIGSTDEIELVNCDSVGEVRSMGEINSIDCDSASFSTREGGYFLNLVVPNSLNKDAMQYHLVSLRNMEQMDTDSPKFTGNQDGFPPSPDRLSGSCIERHGHTHFSEKNPDSVSPDSSSAERNLMFDKQSISKNKYVAVQTACDETSMVAYRLIGHMLDNFAQIEGSELNSSDVSYLGVGTYISKKKNCGVATKEPTVQEEDGCSIIIKAAEEVIPSFTKRQKTRVKNLMGRDVKDR